MLGLLPGVVLAAPAFSLPDNYLGAGRNHLAPPLGDDSRRPEEHVRG
jgi:hypothetical protein